MNDGIAEDYDIYSRLREELDKLPIGYPRTEKGTEIKILKRFFSPLEAEIATHLSMLPEIFPIIYLRIKLNKKSEALSRLKRDEVKNILEELGQKGAIISKKMLKNRFTVFSKAMLAMGIYEFQAKKLTADFVQDLDAYWDQEFGKDMWSTKINQLRVIPIEKSIKNRRDVKSYNEVRNLINKSSRNMGITRCVCRDGMDLKGNPCKVTNERENCFVFAGVADYYLEHGLARKISKEEVLKILDKCEQDGLVLQPGNSRKLNFICTCCSCCCEVLRHLKHYNQPTEYYNSQFVASVNNNECIQCGQCERRCQMNAITMEENGWITINSDRCIGCGLCVSRCPTGAMTLIKNQNEVRPPWRLTSLNLKIYRKKFGFFRYLLVWLKYLFLLKI